MNRLPLVAKIIIVVVLIIGVSLGWFLGLRKAHISLKSLMPKKSKKPAPTAVVELAERTINLADTATPHFLKITISVIVEGTGNAEEELEPAKAKFMDSLLTVTTRYTYSFLLQDSGKHELKEQLLKSFSEDLRDDPKWKAREVLLMDFVME